MDLTLNDKATIVRNEMGEKIAATVLIASSRLSTDEHVREKGVLISSYAAAQTVPTVAA